jgi:diguanylate cyclase (GGDEF)-like protein
VRVGDSSRDTGDRLEPAGAAVPPGGTAADGALPPAAAAALIDGLRDAVVLLTPDGEVVAASAAARRLAGVEGPLERIPEGWWAPGAPGDRGAHLSRLLEAGAQGSFELGIGGRGLLLVTATALPDLRLVRVTVRDVGEERRRRARERVLHRVARAVASEEEPSAVLEAVAEEVARAFHADSARVVLFDGGDAVVIGTWGAGGLPPGTRVPLDGRRALAQVARTGRPARIDDYGALAADDPVSAELVQPGYRTGIAAPIHSGGALWGAILAVSELAGVVFPAGSEHDLAEVGELVGMAVASATARAELRRQATTDPVTGLVNRRAFDTRIAAEAERAAGTGAPLSLVLLDIDDFGAVNDAGGHAAGDAVLAEAAARLAAGAPPGATLARIGGDEFGWILPGTDAEAACAAAEAARARLSATPVAAAGVLTASAGVCDLADAPGGARDLLHRADVALYRAKHGAAGGVVRFRPRMAEEIDPEEQARRLARDRTIGGIRLLARAVDARDPSTQRHSERVAALAERLALRMGWSREAADLLHQAGLVHDVGKIGVPDRILFKRGPLDAAERLRVQGHAALGAELVGEALSPEQTEWVRHHHERPDGRGYPDGVGGTALSPGARILALADAFDAMTAARPYRAPLPVADAMDECRAGTGRQFCPHAVAALEVLWREGALEVPEGAGRSPAAVRAIP